MTKEEIGSILKQLRISSGKTQKEVAEIIGRKQQIVGHWETGYSQPDANTLFTLCEIYGTTVDDAFGFRKTSMSQEDLKLIEKYRSLDTFGKETVNIVLDREATRTQQIKDAPLHQSPAALRIYTYMRKIAAAGTGFYFDDIPTDTIEAPYLEGADFIIGVSGDSMEPDYHDGDKLYVKKVEHLNYGEVGIFTINNECYLKELGSDGLISRNKDYENIPGSEDIRLIGKVIGKMEHD